VANYQRIRRQQALREAEGYLDLTIGFEDQWPLPQPLRARLARRALQALRRIADASDQQSHVLYLTGLAYRAMHRYREALPSLRSAAKLDPDNILIWLALAWCHKRTGRLDRAIASLENALAVDPREAVVHYNLACYWSLAGDAERALGYLAQSFEIDPNYRELVGGEADFDPIRDLPGFQTLLGAIA
jgi:tetratricopeptide (TPR) repeat protein